VDRTCEPMDKKRIEGAAEQGERARSREALVALSPASEKIINREDAEYTFGLNRGEWEAYAKRMVHPDGWKVRISPYDTGTGVMSFDPKSGLGLSVQPLYSDNKGPPAVPIVGSYYPLVWCAKLFCTYRLTRANAALARVTLARMWAALAVQMNGLGSLL
jgi:hypothetical protein